MTWCVGMATDCHGRRIRGKAKLLAGRALVSGVSLAKRMGVVGAIFITEACLGGGGGGGGSQVDRLKLRRELSQMNGRTVGDYSPTRWRLFCLIKMAGRHAACREADRQAGRQAGTQAGRQMAWSCIPSQHKNIWLLTTIETLAHSPLNLFQGSYTVYPTRENISFWTKNW